MALNPTEHSDRPDGPQAAAHMKLARLESDAQPVVTECCSESDEFGRASQDGSRSSSRADRPNNHFARILGEMNAPQMRDDAREERAFWVRLAVGLLIGALAVSIAHAHRMNALQAHWELINAQ
ncbi:MAG: hypothetical protein AAFX90_10225 [Pseudomonadota bacterium]